MKALTHGKKRPRVEVTHISTHGLWLLTDSSELFVSFIDFPRFRTIFSSQLKHVTQLHPDVLFWPMLDIEIPVRRMRCFPLTSAKPHPPRRSVQRAKTRSVTV
ncbi:MAG: hypothetical protein JSR31_00275 [Nitrospira sp.]|nr:hypothetical protein [Nitrospira sp.]